MARVIIFGIKDLAELAHYYLQSDSEHEVVAFSVNKEYTSQNNSFKGLPVIPFEDVEKYYKPSEYYFFAPLTHKGLNKPRERVYQEIKSKGYKMINYISSRAIISDNVIIGENCFILENVVIQPYVKIGNNDIIWSNCVISHHTTVRDSVFLAPSVSISGNCLIESYCFFGIGSTIRDSIKISEGSFISMGACITKETESYTMYQGLPGRKVKKIVEGEF
ncbi:MAG: acetyltransferase [Bacteroidales bacterium]|nr:acetyltransferase [Bacteroidales bacterium]